MEDVDFLEESEPAPQIKVTSPAGAEVTLLHESEKSHYEMLAERYQKDNAFGNISDLQELDRILVMETMAHRWSMWILKEEDYFGEPVDLVGLQRNVESYSKEIRGLKKDLGIDKSSRDKGHGESVQEYINNLRLRAKEFGIVRNNQAVAAVTAIKEIQGIVTLHLNYTDDERTEFKLHEKDVINWLVGKFAEFDRIDQEFRATSQKYYIRDM